MAPGDVDAISVFYSQKSERTKVCVTSCDGALKTVGSSRITFFSIPDDLEHSASLTAPRDAFVIVYIVT